MIFGVERPDHQEEVFEAPSEKDALILAHEKYPEVELKDFSFRQLFDRQTIVNNNQTFLPYPRPAIEPRRYGIGDYRWEVDPWTQPRYGYKVTC